MAFLFDKTFIIDDKDPKGKQFDKVSRLHCRGEEYFDIQLIVDVNDMFETRVGERLQIVLADTLNPDGSPTPNKYDPTFFSDPEKPTHADSFDYVMYGKVFKFKREEDQKLSVLISFGGLLLYIKAASELLNRIHLDSNVFLLMKKLPR